MFARQRFFQAIAFVAISGCSALQSVAQPLLFSPAQGGSSAAPAPPVAPSVEEKRSENAEQLRIAMRKLDANGVSDSATAQEVAFYQTRDAVLAQQDVVEQQVKDLEARKAEFEAQLKSPPENKQYTFAELDRLKDDLAAEQARASLVSDKLATANANLKKAKAAVEECEVKRRQAQTAYESGKNAPNVAELATAADRAQQDAALANETLALRKREVERDELAGQLLKLDIKAQQDLIARVSPQVAFTEADLQEQLGSIKKSEESATLSLARVQIELHSTENEIKNTQQKQDAATGDKSVLTEALTAHRRTRERLSENIDSLAQRLQQLAQLRTAWQRRYEVATAHRDKKDDELWAKFMTAQKETKNVLDQLASNLRTQIINMRSVRNSLSSVAKKAEAAAAGSPELAVQIGIQQRQLEETLKIYEKNLVTIEISRRVHEKLLDEVGQTVESINPKALALGAWYQATMFWNSELFPMGGESITYGKAITCFTILVVGWIMSRFTSGVFANRFLKRFRLSKDATSVIRSLVFYSLLILVSLAALNTINVPLTAFTILGGALAIGVGFGSQTLINNFIGGLIMLAERPVRLGERIMFGGMEGVVEDIGFRCTKLRTPTDHLVTIPNSTLVNESIENIGRRRTIRRKMNVTITYDTPRELIAEAVQAIRDILDEKEIRERIHPIVGFEEFPPRVYFNDFNAESLNIVVIYWYAPVDWWAYMQHSERVNYRIMEEFERLGVEFAFPTQTIYLKNQASGAAASDAAFHGDRKKSSAA